MEKLGVRNGIPSRIVVEVDLKHRVYVAVKFIDQSPLLFLVAWFTRGCNPGW